MKFACSLEMVNLQTSGPNFIYKQSKHFWVEFLKYVSAAGFRGIALPFNPFTSDPMAFETGRCGCPVSARAVADKYGSPAEFLDLLHSLRIQQVACVHMNANDVMLELNAAGRGMEDYFPLLEELSMQAVEHAASLKAAGIVLSPSPELGWLKLRLGTGWEEDFTARSVEVFRRLAAAAGARGLEVSVTGEFWSFFRGKKLKDIPAGVPGVTICPDFAHLAITGDPVLEIVRHHAKDYRFVYLTDTAFTDTAGNYRRINAELPVEGPQKVFSDLGEGTVPLGQILEFLRGAGFDGWAVCEQRRTADVYRGLLKLRWFIDSMTARAG